MKIFSLLLLCLCLQANATAQWLYSARTSVGVSTAEGDEHSDDLKGGVYGLGARVGYDFAGRVGVVSLGLDYERYRDFSVHREFFNRRPDFNDHVRYRSTVEGWHALRLGVEVEGPFFILADEGPLRMFVNAGLMVTGGTEQYGAVVPVPDSTAVYYDYDYFDVKYAGKVSEDGRVVNPLKRLNGFAGFGLAYRLTPVLSIAATYEESFRPVGRVYQGEYVDDFGRTERWERLHFGAITNFRLSMNVRIF